MGYVLVAPYCNTFDTFTHLVSVVTVAIATTMGVAKVSIATN
jgi:hypothetical protein